MKTRLRRNIIGEVTVAPTENGRALTLTVRRTKILSGDVREVRIAVSRAEAHTLTYQLSSALKATAPVEGADGATP